MHMLLRVRIANLILEVVVDHPNQVRSTEPLKFIAGG
ncbi:hypothetical protein T4D_8609 [Trichinella pseudospiralis]|uniref:Uncharacterized protein n=1 Tax=Trichinella pseudospiralis TaxID=6337 RepID=A0A0V1DLC2_TRIPS|nr:hypothetical protein T4D_8609 [Trichinella pseudospiralis]